ncbi:amelotin [Acomys russatus]|uniref:amelotin n=1 Tax=Acomys russatus TaxID=60746 RepID=UPI0021E2702C|nr:amelotin [Acomys russatus]
MKTTILLWCLLGSTQSLPKQVSPASGLPPTKPTPDQARLRTQQQPNQIFPSINLIPLTQLLTLGSDLQLFHPAAVAHGAQTLPFTLGPLNGQQQLQPQVLPIIVAQLGAQGTLLSSEELPLASQIITGLLIHPLFPGGIPPSSQAGVKPDVQTGVLPAGQAGATPANQGTTPGHVTTPGVTDDDDYEMSTPAGMRRATHTTDGTTVDPPNSKLSRLQHSLFKEKEPSNKSQY